jgi:hypothetical protein
MADEFNGLANPTFNPDLVSTGYQAQNINIIYARLGLDCTLVEGGVGSCYIRTGGPVEVNGVQYFCGSDVTLTPADGAGRYYIVLTTGTTGLTPVLSKTPGSFVANKNARYSSNQRVLNWFVDFDGTDCIAERWVTPEGYTYSNYLPSVDAPERTWLEANGTWYAPRTKFFEIWLTGAGATGGAGGTGGDLGVDPIRGTAGGRAGSSGVVRKYIVSGQPWAVAIGANAAINDGVTAISANGSGGAVTNCDKSFVGGGGNIGGNGGTGPGHPGQAGGASIYGSGGSAGAGGGYNATGAAGGNGSAFGSGGGSGGGGGGLQAFGGAGGTGGPAVVCIIG